MKILIACEYSGVVREAFSAVGHDATSCDILPTERPGQHIQGDVRELDLALWDMLIAFPPCTYLCGSGMHWTTRGLRAQELTEDALEFVRFLLNAPVDRIALENPLGVISTRIRPYQQRIQPYQFGDDASKGTCLWLKGLEPLTIDPALRCAGRLVQWKGKTVERWSNQTDSGQNRLGPSETRGKDRAKTYPGIALAMASQWGGKP